ncbi:AfsR/SARP family transcriptional regulator [Streptacidiphilus rugosus]|uniref:AfsR/SARP family transcriptional regulator n=1 Tax=Streptacidiphilus rugosus TaxID=405783 RepID=UPI0022B35980|nr:BTAD domain-containing putative transcriptional regulator [Streptacidiphilus rugosus]
MDGRSIALGGPRARRLLALLILHNNEVVSVERIVDTLWDEPPSSARQQVHNVVGGLRRALRAGERSVELVTSEAGYSLKVEPAIVDLARFQTRVQEADLAASAGDVEKGIQLLSEALDTWRGEPLGGLSTGPLANAVTVLTDQRLSAVERLAELRLDRGRPAESIPNLVELVEAFPYRESLRAWLMRLLQAAGRQADALALFDEGRRLLSEELGLDPSLVLQEAHSYVLAGAPTTVHGPPSQHQGQAPTPLGTRVGAERRFLPRDIVEFTGREAELRQLVEDARQVGTGALVVSAINGMGGVGKTTLAVRLAHMLTEDYPDGQFFIDLQGFSAGAEPVEPTQALKSLLLSVGTPPELIPMDLESRSALWRSHLAGRRALLLLDNAVSAVQVRPLLPGTPDSLVLISSRRRMPSLEGSVPLSLDVMNFADAIALFSCIVGQERTEAEQDAAAQVVNLCGRLPLAIQVAASRLRDRVHWAIDDAVGQLKDQESRSRFLTTDDRSVMTVLTWSYRHLSERQQAVFRLLGIHPGADFDAYCIAALADISLAEAITILDELFDVHLLEQRSPGRYSLHDLLRDCSLVALRRDGRREEREEATRRLLDYYLWSVHSWSRPIIRSWFRFEVGIAHMPRFVIAMPSAEEALDRLEGEYRNIRSAITLALDTGSHEHVWQLICSLLPYFSARFDYGVETEELATLGLGSARIAGNLAGESMCLMALAHSRRTRGDSHAAQALAEQAISLSSENGDREREVYQRTGLGIVHLDENRFEDALECFTAAMELSLDVGDRESEAGLTNNLGVVCRELGRLDEALRYLQRTLALELESDSRSAQAFTLSNIAQIWLLRGDGSAAETAFSEALVMSRAVRSKRAETLALLGLCATKRWTSDLVASLGCGREALETARQADWFDLEGDSLNALGDTYLSLGDLDSAENIFIQAGSIAQERNSERYLARAREGLAHTAAARGDLLVGRYLWHEALRAHPGGVVDAAAARGHLDAAHPADSPCWRCALVQPRSH